MPITPSPFRINYQKELNRLIDAALKEDIGTGDHSALACVPEGRIREASLLVKEDCVLAGVEMAAMIFDRYNSSIQLTPHFHDGNYVTKGSIAFEVTGSARALLATERLVLNCMQRMSGIASLCHQLTDNIRHTSCQLLDTRKTTPNFRHAEKWAVTIGGGTNHRMGLYDELMIKDNHIDYNGSLHDTLNKVAAYLDQTQKKPVVVETRNLEEVVICKSFPWIHRILLDNMDPTTLCDALEIIDGQFPTEASGNITATNLVAIAETGVDFISMGALTHSAKNIDLSLKAQ